MPVPNAISAPTCMGQCFPSESEAGETQVPPHK